jgi:tRNA A37 threonylcarbamoyladenosine modification protein TsaB
MYLLINTSQRDSVDLTFFDEGNSFDKHVDAKNRDLLLVIDEFLNEKKLNKEDVQGIAVVVGEGGFTSTRISVTVANTFAYANKIPVVTVDLKEAEDLEVLIEKIKNQDPGTYVSATYSGEPNIGGK